MEKPDVLLIQLLLKISFSLLMQSPTKLIQLKSMFSRFQFSHWTQAVDSSMKCSWQN